jgi:hypothetical protein
MKMEEICLQQKLRFFHTSHEGLVFFLLDVNVAQLEASECASRRC